MIFIAIFCQIRYNIAMNFILAQIMGGIALVLVVISVFLKQKKYYFAMQIVANFFYALSFIFNGGIVAGINSFISIVRVSVLYIFERKQKPAPIYLIAIFSVLYITVGIIFFKTPLDIITIVTPILFTIAMWMKNMQLVRYMMIAPNVLLSIYAILLQVYTTALLDALEVVFIVIAIVKFHIQEHREKKQNNANSFSCEIEDKNFSSKTILQTNYKNYFLTINSTETKKEIVMDSKIDIPLNDNKCATSNAGNNNQPDNSNKDKQDNKQDKDKVNDKEKNKN